jgi:hypothetical protein
VSTPERDTTATRAVRYKAIDRHFDRLYRRIDELSARVSKLERAIWVGSGALTATGGVAVFNLISNLNQGGG